MALLAGLTGNMGSGKTTVASLLQELGAYIIDADKICRELVLPHKAAWNEIIRFFGKEILQKDQSLDRKKLADLVFNNKTNKAALEKILHPKVIAEEKNIYQQIVKKDPRALVIVDAALLIESGNYREMNKVIVVTCDRNTQINRAMNRTTLSQEEVELRISGQMSQEDKIKKADCILENNGSLHELKKKVEGLYRQLQNLT